MPRQLTTKEKFSHSLLNPVMEDYEFVEDEGGQHLDHVHEINMTSQELE